MAKQDKRTFRSDFRRFFVKGLAVLLPTVLTLWILVKCYEFVDVAIAQPINGGIRYVMNKATPHVEFLGRSFEPTDAQVYKELAIQESARRSTANEAEIRTVLRGDAILKWWDQRWYMNFIGLAVAILAVYIAGRMLGGFLGRRIQGRIESLLTSIPGIKQIYPYVKQIVDFIISDEKKIKFNRVVMVEYPRKGVWSIGLVTGSPMKSMHDQIAPQEGPSLTVFIPSSPTPFTGYTITVPRNSVIELPISVEEALRFTISGGVLIPSHQYVSANDIGELPNPPTGDPEEQSNPEPE